MKALAMTAAALWVSVGILHDDQDKAGHGEGAKHVMIRPEAVKWGPGPASLPPGVEMALLVGDPRKAGPYVARAKMPDGYQVPPHWHPTDENITVLKGTFLMGAGDRFDAAAAEELGPGSYVRMPKGTRHFAAAKGETIIQLHGTEPFDITYVNPADDPRGAGEKKGP